MADDIQGGTAGGAGTKTSEGALPQNAQGEQPQGGNTTQSGGQQTQGTTGSGTENAAKGGQPAPAEWDVKLPEGVVGGKLLEDFKEFAKSNGFKGDQAQKLVELYSNSVKDSASAAEETRKQERAQWVASIEKDKELGGQNLAATRAAVQRSMATYASPELNQFLDSSGLGDNPEMVRLFARLGKAMREDRIASTTQFGGSGALTEQDILNARYPSMVKQP